jgi:hypothetical protein
MVISRLVSGVVESSPRHRIDATADSIWQALGH